MRILVTGGAGFIGSHLCERLLSEGHEVVCLDNLSTGRRENVQHLTDSGRFELLRHDIIEPVLLEVEQIYNLACPASPVHYQHDPLKTVKTSVLGAVNMLDLAARVGARVLQASTSEVYGDPEVHPQPEEYRGRVNCVGLRACYSEGKRVAETLMTDSHRQSGVDTRIIRIFNTYGPRMLEDDGRVVSNFVVQALRGEELTVHGTGAQTRSFCYVDDLVEGMVRLMNVEQSASDEYDVHDPVNVGNPSELTVRELADEVSRAVGREARTRSCPLPQDNPRRRRPDITRARKLLGWEPTVTLREGLRRSVDYFAERIKGRGPLAVNRDRKKAALSHHGLRFTVDESYG